MYIVAIAWMYVVLMMSVAEGISSTGTALGAVITFVLYGLLPLSVVMYLLGTPGRKAARVRAEALEEVQAASATSPAPVPVTAPDSAPPDGGHHAPGDTVTTEGKEP